MTRAKLSIVLPFLLAACSGAPDDTSSAPSPTGEGTLTPAAAAPAATEPAQPMPPSVGQSPSPTPDCGASRVTSYIGQEATVPVRIAVAREARSGTDRWIYPDSMVTEDYSPTRLNVMLDRATNRIVSMRCG